MRIAYYAPLKPPDHPIPSGDRLMANLLMKALAAAGHEVLPASSLRTFSHDPGLPNYTSLKAEAHAEAARLAAGWSAGRGATSPDCWFCYHPYYRAPDWIGPVVCAELGIPYITAEASYAGKRNHGPWQIWQADLAAALNLAACNFTFTAQDHAGLIAAGVPASRLARLDPFLDPPTESPRQVITGHSADVRLVSIAMMRPGVKLESFRMLGQALAMLLDTPWHLTIIGDGPARAEVVDALAAIPEERIAWKGQLPPERVGAEVAACDLYVWPGTGEAYGLAYLEAQAMGLPVVAQATGGVGSVVRHGETGWLTPFGDTHAFAEAIRNLLDDADLRARAGARARRFVREERSIANAARTLDSTLRAVCARHRGVPQ